MALVCDFKSENSHTMTETSIDDDSIKPEPTAGATPPPDEIQNNDISHKENDPNDDLEDGEIEDDDDEEEDPTEPAVTEPQQILGENLRSRSPSPVLNNKNNKFGHPAAKVSRFDRADRRNRYEERKHGHLTEAEKSVLHLRKLERLEREKRERYKREQNPAVDDFASNIEKAIANVLKKDKKGGSEDEKDEEEKRGKKRKKKDKDKRKNKQRKLESPNLDEVDENDLLNIRKVGSPDQRKIRTRSSSPHSPSEFDSRESSPASDRSREERKDTKIYKKDSKKKNERNRNDKRKRDHKTDNQQNKEGGAQGMLCTFYMQGKCTKGDDCPFSHGVSAPIKMELCKFYLMDCCAKGDKCLYMHSQFPCKFYHTGIVCKSGDFCKFSHGKPLSEAHKQILFKHIETAPKEILGEFPRLNRDDALSMINSTQKSLEGVYGAPKNDMTSESNRASIPSLFDINVSVPTGLLAKNADKEKNEKPAGRERSRPSRWQSNDKEEQQQQQQPVPLVFGLSGYYSERGDQDMRVTSNGDIDMRTLPPTMNTLVPNVTQAPALTTETNSIKDIVCQDVDIRKESRDVDIRQLNALKDVDTRVHPQFDTHLKSVIQDLPDSKMDTSDEPKLTIVEDRPVLSDSEPKSDVDNRVGKEIDIPAGMPKIQRELFLRIQAQQKENLPETPQTAEPEDDQNDIDWYSDDDDDNRLTIKDDVEDFNDKDEIEEPSISIQLPAPIKPMEVIEQLGDLSKIDISEEVTKLLSTISQVTSIKEPTKEPPKDPRVASRTNETSKPSTPANDPRRSRVNSTDHEKVEKVERISIYEQGSISIENASKDVDLRGNRDSDLRPTFGDTDLRPPPPGRPDIDLRQLGLPFKPMQNYTPATEIDASVNSHPPIVWKLIIADIPQPDYAGLKLSAHEAQNTGDPRLRKLFKLNIDEKDSPASPKESPKAVVTGIRADPRRRKQEEKTSMNELNYSQQLNVLQTSAFYQSLTSNQKLLLNQELSNRSDHTGTNDPTLNGILATLGLITVSNTISPTSNAATLNILTNVNNLNPMLGQPPGLIQVPGSLMMGNQPFVPPGQVNPNMLAQNPNMVNQIAQGVQPGLMGNGTNLPIVTDFQLNFDPRQGGLLGNAPPINYDNSNYNYGGDDFYEGNNYVEEGGGGGNRGRGRGRGNFRDRQRRGGQNFRGGRNNSRNFRNRNRINRSLTPP